jgi:cell division protein FtsA
MSNVIVGLDIGTTKVCAIIGKRNEHGKVEVFGMGKAESLGVIRGEVRNIEKAVRSIVEAVEKAKLSLLKNNSNIKLEINSVHVGIAGQHIKSMQHRNSISLGSEAVEVSREDVRRLIEDTYKLALSPGDQIIHVLPQEYAVDEWGEVLDPIGMSGVRLSSNFHIITGNIDAIKNIGKSVNRAGLELADLILEPLSSAEAVLTPEEMEAGVCLVDIGGGTTDVAIFKNNIIRHTAVIPFGGNIITNDVEEGCNVLKNQAEALKVKFGSALADENKDNEIVSIPSFHGRPPKEVSIKNLAMVIQARVEEIFESVLYEIKSSGLEKKLNAGIVITGGGSQLKHLDKLVEYVTSLDARIGYANEHLGKTAVEEINSPIYATGVGLVIKGLKAAEEKDAISNIKDEKERKNAEQEVSQKEGNILSRLLKQGQKWLYENDDLKDF